MKKFLASILCIFYMASAMGATVHIHYCMGELADISLTCKEEIRCNKCGMKKTEKNKGCCQDKYKTFKTNDHKQPNTCKSLSCIYLTPFIKHTPEFYFKPYFGNITYLSTKYLLRPIFSSCLIFIKIRNIRI